MLDPKSDNRFTLFDSQDSKQKCIISEMSANNKPVQFVFELKYLTIKRVIA